MEPLPRFPLFPDPLREKIFEQSEEPCELCNRAGGYLYTGPQYHEGERIKICPWCIADGTAEARGIDFNDSWSDDEVLTDYEEAKLLCRTPGFITWQSNEWRACCGRVCIYLGEAFTADLKGRWASAVPTMFDERYDQEEIDHIVSEFTGDRGRGAYVFQCQTCVKLKGYWDCD